MHQQARTNTSLSLIIEQGIARDLLHGSVLAWKFMAAHGVPTAMIARVLAYPGQRRQSDIPGNHGDGRQPASNDAAHQPQAE